MARIKGIREEEASDEVRALLEDHGATPVWQKDGRKHTFEWHPASLFVIPLNAS